MNTQPYYITQAQYQTLQGHVDSGNRVGFYIALHQMTGSSAALDMAEISSSTGLRGGTAWAINEAMLGTVPGYPPEGVAHFSVAIAAALKNSFTPQANGLWEAPSEIRTYEIAQQTWNDVGRINGNPTLGYDYFPGNSQMGLHYIQNGRVLDGLVLLGRSLDDTIAGGRKTMAAPISRTRSAISTTTCIGSTTRSAPRAGSGAPT